MQEVDLVYGAPSFDVVAGLLVRLKSNLKLSSTSFDVKLTQFINQSIELIGRYTNRVLVKCVVTGRFTKPVQCDYYKYPSLYFPVAPVYRGAFVSVTWSDGVNADEILTGFAMPRQEQGHVYITKDPSITTNYGSFNNWLASKPTELYPIIAVINAGYDRDAGLNWLCPLALQQAIISLATYFYDNPSECGSCSSGVTSNGVTLPSSVAMLAGKYQVRRVF